MFIKKTVFILGAGSSHWCGYPLGDRLIDNITLDMEDEIYIPVPKRLLCSQDAYKEPYPLEWILEETAFLIDPDSFLKRCYPYPEKRVGGGISSRQNYYRKIKILDIAGFKDLKDRLDHLDPNSIDSFLQKNETCRDLAKQMIVYSLLKRENKNIFSKQKDRNDNWYKHFFHDLTVDCDAESLLSNKVDIITFNYDISLEFYLYSRLLETDKFRAVAQEFADQKKIIHIYGDISFNNDKSNYGRFFHDESTDNKSSSWILSLSANQDMSLNPKIKLNTERFLTSSNLHCNIKTMYDERYGKTREQLIEENKRILLEAEDIIIIGFGFDRSNLTQLGLPIDEQEWSNFFTPKNGTKTIKWHNYGGEKTRVSSLLNKVKNGSSIELVESPGLDISSAYVNAFR